MPEYLSPGVYVEEVESGAVPMEGVSTSTAGFIGMAARGPVMGKPQLVTSFADYQRTYGGYLSEAKYGAFRFLPYAVEQFFLNGGSRAYIMRVVPQGSKCSVSKASAVLSFAAATPGEWGDRIRVAVEPSSKAKTQALEALDDKTFRVKSCDGFAAGDVVELTDGKAKAYNVVKSAMDGVLTLENPAGMDIVDTKLLPTKLLKTCELNVFVKYEDAEESYIDVSLNEASSSYIVSRMQKSELVTVTVDKAAAPKSAAAPAVWGRRRRTISLPMIRAPSRWQSRLASDMAASLSGCVNRSATTETRSSCFLTQRAQPLACIYVALASSWPGMGL